MCINRNEVGFVGYYFLVCCPVSQCLNMEPIGKTKKVVCYYGSWSVYRAGKGKFKIEDIQPHLCTHLIYAFVGLNPDGTIKILDNDKKAVYESFKQFNALKKINKKLKTLVAIGGYAEGSTKYSDVAADKNLRRAFIENAIHFVDLHGFDGLDIDWEYPAQLGGSPDDKVNFCKLLKKFRAAAGPDFLLTVAVGASEDTIHKSYDVPKISQYVDFINVMTYDLHGAYEGVTGQNAPLAPAKHETTSYEKQRNVTACIDAWLRHGAPPSKLMLGIGAYGRSFTLRDCHNAKLGAPVSGPGLPGPYTAEPGMLGYNEIYEKLHSNTWTRKWDDYQKVPYMYKGNQWVGYDDDQSVLEKVRFAKFRILGGVMVWSIDTDDFRGNIHAKYPLLHTINVNLKKNT